MWIPTICIVMNKVMVLMCGINKYLDIINIYGVKSVFWGISENI